MRQCGIHVTIDSKETVVNNHSFNIRRTYETDLEFEVEATFRDLCIEIDQKACEFFERTVPHETVYSCLDFSRPFSDKTIATLMPDSLDGQKIIWYPKNSLQPISRLYFWARSPFCTEVSAGEPSRPQLVVLSGFRPIYEYELSSWTDELGLHVEFKIDLKKAQCRSVVRVVSP